MSRSFLLSTSVVSVVALCMSAGISFGAAPTQRIPSRSGQFVDEYSYKSASSRRLAHPAGESPARAKVRSPVAWVADRRETECSEAD
jgi:hypothetical protein